MGNKPSRPPGPGEYVIALLGAEKVGKTSLEIRFQQDTFFDNPILGHVVSRQQVLLDGDLGHVTIMSALELGPDARGITERLMMFAEAFVLVYDCTSLASFNQIPLLHKLLQDVRQEDNVHCILVANKIDLVGEFSRSIDRFLDDQASAHAHPSLATILEAKHISFVGCLSQIVMHFSSLPLPLSAIVGELLIEEDHVSTRQGRALAASLNCQFMEASAKEGLGVDKIFYGTIRALRRRRQE